MANCAESMAAQCSSLKPMQRERGSKEMPNKWAGRNEQKKAFKPLKERKVIILVVQRRRRGKAIPFPFGFRLCGE